MVRLGITLLGGFRATVDGRPVPDDAWRHRRGADLVKLLALAPRHRLTREQVVEALWPRLDAEAGLANLHKAAHLARRALGEPGALVLRGGLVSLAPEAEVEVDAERFIADRDPSLYRGDLLPDDRYADWTAEARDRLRDAFLDTLRTAGRWQELAEASPTDEEAGREVMRALARRGERAAALRQFARLADALAADGLRPGPETVALQRELVRGPAAVAPVQGGRPLLGRERELEAARAAWQRAAAGRGGALLVRGEAGVGKTRLCEVLLAEAAEAGWTTLRGAAREEEGAVPYGPIAEALDRLLVARPDLPAALTPGAVAELARLSVAVPGDPPAPSGPAERKRILSAVAQLVAAAARERGAVLLVEDLHAADEATLQLVHYLARTARLQPLLVVLSHRESPSPTLAAVRAGLLEQRTADEVALGPLPEGAARELVAACAPHATADAAEAINRLAGGNPFFLEELAAAVGADGTIGAPSRLYEILHARLARLGPEVRRALERIAVAGAAFGAGELGALTGLAEEPALEALDGALAAGVLVEVGASYAFRHAIVREALLRSVPSHRLAAAHRETADRLAAAGAPPARVAHHLLESGLAREASPWLARAAAEAASVAAFADGLGFVELALGGASDAERPGLLALRADLLLATGDPGAREAYGAALAASPAEVPELRVRQAKAHLAAGDVASAAAAIEGVEAHELRERVPLLITRGLVSWFRGDVDAAGRDADEARALAVVGGLTRETYEVGQLLGMVAHARGQWPERVWQDLAETLGSPALAATIFDGHFCVVEYILASGEGREEIVVLADGLRSAARRSGARRAEAFATTFLGEAELLAGELMAAEAHLGEAVELNRRVGATCGESLARLRRGEAVRALGRGGEALSLFDEALVLGQHSSLPGHVLYLVYATILASCEDPESAIARLDEAEALLDRPLACLACPTGFHIAAAVACAGAGRIERAGGHLRRAEEHASLWTTGPWPAAMAEARGAIALADGATGEAARLFGEAADGFARWARPLDAARARGRLARVG